MPFAATDVRWSIACGIGPSGHWHGRIDIQVQAGALRRLGLHPDQPTAAITVPRVQGIPL